MLPHSVAPAEIRTCACGCGRQVKTSMGKGGMPVIHCPGHHRVKDGVVLRTLIPCARCGRLFLRRARRARYCSRACYWIARGCATKPFTGRWGVQTVDRTEFRVSASPRIQRLHVLARKSACDECGWNMYIQLLELHHVNENKRDGRWENLRLLCPTCHEIHHFLTKTGRHDSTRYAKAKKIREALGLPTVGRGLTRTTIQGLIEDGTIKVQ